MSNSSRKQPDSKQVVLGLKPNLKTLYSIERFYPGQSNKLALDAVTAFTNLASQKVLVFTGSGNSGKTHLLNSIYYSWSSRKNYGQAYLFDACEPAGLDGLSAVSNTANISSRPILVCIDNLDSTSLDEESYENVFHLFNSLSNTGGYLAVAMRSSPAKCRQMPDYLSSRLLTGMVVPLKKPKDSEMKSILIKLASDKNIFLTPNAQKYILERGIRSIGSLLETVERIENAAHPSKGRIGLQLIKRMIHWNNDDTEEGQGSGDT
jgi:chromosomal replication initiation ATPase DnaA